MEPKITISSKKGAIKVSLQEKETIKQKPQPLVKSPEKRNQIGVSTGKISSPIGWRAASVQSPIKKHKKRNRGNQEMISITLSIVGAIIVGIIMGASLLSIFFSNEPTYSQNSIDSHLQQATQNKKGSKTSFRVYLLQAGTYRHKSGAQDKIRSYRKQGLAAVSSEAPPYCIYLGVSLDQIGAKKLETEYEKKGTKVYIKEVTIKANQDKSKIKELDIMDQQSRKIFTELSRNSIDQLTSEIQTDKGILLQPQLIEAYQKLLSSAQNIKHRLSAEDQENLMTMIQSLDQAVQSAKEAKTHPSSALMWQIQEGLVRYITTYERFQS